MPKGERGRRGRESLALHANLGSDFKRSYLENGITLSLWYSNCSGFQALSIDI